MRISYWSSDVCSSDLLQHPLRLGDRGRGTQREEPRESAGFAEHEAGGNDPIVEADPERFLRVDELAGDEELGSLAVTDDPRQEIGRASCRERVCQSV